MGFPRLGALALSTLAVASAFQDTSPLFMFSTSKELDGFETRLPQLTTAKRATKEVMDALKACTARSYVVVSQPGVQTTDYTSSTAATYLQHYVGRLEKRIASSATVPEIVEGLDADRLTEQLASECGDSTTSVVDAADGYISLSKDSSRVIRVRLTEPAQYPEERMASLKQNDIFLDAVIQSLHEANYTVIYTTTPPSKPYNQGLIQEEHAYEQYEMDDTSSALHVELKRDIGARASNDSLPLFEKYMFFSPAIFMGFIAILPLFLLAYVGVSAVAGLEVSYFAFSKEMGPAGQKKQQQ